MTPHRRLRLRYQHLTVTGSRWSQSLAPGNFSLAGTSLRELYLIIFADLLFNASVISLLYRRNNLALSLVLLIGCYSAILIPVYFPLDQVATLGNDFHHPKDLVRGCLSSHVESYLHYHQTHLYVFPSLQVLLNRSATLLSGPCRPGWCLNHLTSLSFSAGLVDIPVFVQQDRPVPWELSPPLGLQGSEEHLALALASLPEHSLPPSLGREGSCRRCMVVGNGGVLHGSHLGSHIDQYDIIIRCVCQCQTDTSLKYSWREFKN